MQNACAEIGAGILHILLNISQLRNTPNRMVHAGTRPIKSRVASGHLFHPDAAADAKGRAGGQARVQAADGIDRRTIATGNLAERIA